MERIKSKYETHILKWGWKANTCMKYECHIKSVALNKSIKKALCTESKFEKRMKQRGNYNFCAIRFHYNWAKTIIKCDDNEKLSSFVWINNNLITIRIVSSNI